MRVLVLTGPPGCGKSTFTNRARKKGKSVQVLSMDSFRVAIWGSKRDYWRIIKERPKIKVQLSNIYEFSVRETLTRKEFDHLILDNTHIQGSYWGGDTVGPIFRYCAKADIEPEVIVFRAGRATVLQRNRDRPEDDRVPHEIVANAWDLHEDKTAWWRHYTGVITEIHT